MLPENRIETASEDLQEALREHAHRVVLRLRVVGPITAIDAMLTDLEEMNVAGRRRVPKAWSARLARLVAFLPAEIGQVPDLRSNISPSRLMDGLFELQDALLDLKVGPLRHSLLVSEGPDILEVA